ncbi:xylosyltransferase oxt-like [Varroa destructor]|uniref:protein xylosyltransferase n=1 Tax=Varroa destructor TaxID=109461 RepID=A0A7M7KBR6_VARDE|nr:xylosyltransferase oxt-like [Varroa destructor]
MCSVASRGGRSNPVRVFRKYLPFIFVALAIIISQGLFLVYSLHWLPESLPPAGAFHTSKPLRANSTQGHYLHGGLTSKNYKEHVEGGGELLRRSTTELPFEPSCSLNGTEVQSALKRAQTAHCKRQIADVFCAHLRRSLYPTFLNNTCPSKEGNPGDTIGCFRLPNIDSLQTPHYVANNTLAKHSAVSYPTPMSCVWACLRVGAPFAVFRSSSSQQEERRCACAKVQDKSWKRVEKPCSDDQCQDCGELYKTGLPIQMKKHQPLMPPADLSDNSPRAKIVFLLTVNGRALRQLKRLISVLNTTSTEQHFFYVHVDQRQDYLYRSLKELEDPSWLRVTPQRFSTIWGGASLLQMLLSCFQELLHLDKSTDRWDYVVNLSESDFPIKRVGELELFLGDNKGYNFVRSHGQDTPKFISKQALMKTFLECETRMWRLGDRELPRGIRFDGGSDWVALHRGFVQWVIQNRAHDPLLVGLEALFRHTLLPAESYFHTVLHNSGFCTLIVDNNLRFVNWRRKQGCKCQYRHVVDWCGCSPNVLLEDDEGKVAVLSRKTVFFARKFEPVLSQKIVDFIEDTMLKIKRKPTSNLASETSYWQNEFHYLDRSPVPDQGRLSAWSSLARLSAHHLGQLGSRCVLRASRVLETWLYFQHDLFKGVIIQYEARAEHLPEPVKVEALVSPIKSFQKSGKFENDPFDDRLRRIEVSSDFDVKELLFRNFAGIMGPQSEPGVLHEWGRGPASSVTFVWIDPAQVVAGSYEVKVGISEQIEHHKPPLRKPLRPGVWKLKMFKNWVLMAETSFIVVPQTHLGGLPVKNTTIAAQLNGGPAKGYTEADLSTVEDFLGISKATKETLIREATLRSLRSGAVLEEWADALTFSRWSVKRICFAATPAHPTGGVFCPQLRIEPCHYTSWSTLAPDVKEMLSAL